MSSKTLLVFNHPESKFLVAVIDVKSKFPNVTALVSQITHLVTGFLFLFRFTRALPGLFFLIV
jgi:hypothetical protein